MAIPPKLGTEEVCEVLLFGTAIRNFLFAISTIDGMRKKVIPAANPKQSNSLRSITESANIGGGLYHKSKNNYLK
jgi:hypothetical protein